MNRLFLATAAAGLMLCGGAKAAEYEFTFTDIISSADTPGIDAGDAFTLHLFADNGGSTAVSQTWNLDDLLGFTIQAGSYSASYSTVFDNDATGFVTDASGLVSSVVFFGTSFSSNNTDNFGSWTGDVVTGDATFCDVFGRCNTVSAGGFNNASKWTVAAAGAIPEPSTWTLMLLGFAGLGVAGYRSSRKNAVVGV